MPAATAARLAATGTLALALALAPGAAFAQTAEDDRGRSSSAQERDGKGGSTRASASPKPSAKPTQAAPASRGKGGSTGATAGKGTSGEGRAAGGDPRGNNGTVKIDGIPFDDGRGMEPHVGCTFQIEFYGFDLDDRADMTLTAHAPTAGGVVWSLDDKVISNDAAGGGKDVDAVVPVTLTAADFAGIAPHPKQGYHVKLAVDVESAPGGAKQKVFWIRCAPAAGALGGTSTEAATGGTTRTTSVDTRTLGSGTAELAGTGVLSGTTSAQAANGAAGATAGAGEATVSARSANRPSALPFTGVEGLAYLLALGAGAVGVGVAAHRLGRRRAVTPEA